MNMFELVENYTPSAEIKVIGVGGGGGNAVSQMIDAGIDGVEFIAANTDAQALRQFKGRTLLQIGSSVTKGLGAGANPEVGRQAALEDRDRIIEMIAGADMVFITAGMGGGTGTGAAPVIAQAAKELGILTVAVVTKPFHFEAKRRMAIAEQGIEELSKHVDSLIIIPNSKLPEVMGADALLLNAFKAANDVLQGAVQGIAELITRQGLINVDFADVRTVMSEMGQAVMGAGQARGEDRAIMAVQAAIGSPLLEEVNLQGACGVLVNITAGMNMTMREFEEIGSAVADLASDDATVVIGTVIDPEIGDELRVTVVATGLNDSQRKRQPKEPVETTIHMVRNGTTGQPEPGFKDMSEQQNDLGGKGRFNEQADTTDMFAPDSKIDYLDIPSFLRNQAD
ncbi:MAG: cell division protein FtsZ [Xanthomonadales bacterium]|nr:cell division protein FtsZ [Xanthomonadales bacterium]